MEVSRGLFVILAIIGILVLIAIIINLAIFLRAIYAYKLRKVLCGDCPKEIRRIVEYQRTSSKRLFALVTGATDGIGLAYAKALASFGVNVIVVGRNAEKIDNAMKVVSEGNNVEVRSLKVDFNDLDQSKLYKYIADSTQDLDIVMLVNNVGVGYPRVMNLQEVSDELWEQIININIRSTVGMCRIFVPRMLNFSTEISPIIVNLSSITQMVPSSGWGLYNASKSFVTCATQALVEENHKKNLIIQCILPGVVATKMTGMAGGSPVVATPEEFASEALSSLGILTESYGCLKHHLQVILIKLLPLSIMRILTSFSKK